MKQTTPQGVFRGAVPTWLQRQVRVSLILLGATWLALPSGAQILTGNVSQVAGPSSPGFPTTVTGGTGSSLLGNGVSPGNPADVGGDARRFKYAFRLTLGFLYDDNIFIRRDRKTGDFIFSVEPGVTFGWGDIFKRTENYLRVDYAPGIYFYGKRDDQDNVEHALALAGQYRFNRLALRVSQNVQILNGADTDSGARVSRNIYQTVAGLSYALTGKTSVDVGATYVNTHYDSQIDNYSLSGNVYVNYAATGKWTFGLGVVGGVQEVDGPLSPTQTFQQINVRANYQATGKISFNGSLGVEIRQYDGARSTTATPVFELGMVWQPFDGTTVTVRGGRRTTASSVLVAQNYTNSSISASLRQRFLQRIFLTLSTTYENSDYEETVRTVRATRTDNFITVQLSADYTLREGWSAGVFYLHRDNFSNNRAFEFSNNQVGIRTTITF